MRLAIIPPYSSPHNLETCGIFNQTKAIVNEMVRQFPDLYVYVTVPAGSEELAEREMGHERVSMIPVTAHKNQYMELVNLPSELLSRFAEMGGDLYVDAVLTGKPAILPYLSMALHTWGENGSGGVKLGWLNAFFMRESSQGFLRDEYFRDQILSLSAADVTFWIDHVLKDGIGQAKNVLSFAEIKRMREKALIVGGPADTARLDKYLVDRDPEAQRVVNFAFALNSVYKAPDTLEFFDYLFARGNRDIEVLVTSPSLNVGKIPEQYQKYMNIHLGLPQEQFFQTIASAHAFVAMPAHTELSLSIIEQQYLGLVGVFADKPYSHTHCYPKYPFIGKNKKEMHGMLRYVLDNYFMDEIQEVVEKQRSYIRDNFSGAVLSRRIYEGFRNIVSDDPPGCEGSITPMLEKAFEDVGPGERIEYDDWCARIKAANAMNHDPSDMKPTMYGLSKNRFRKSMMKAGFRDTFDTENPTFVRAEGS